jgi:hypothetical protein
VELVYVNDNYGDFVADRNALTRAALEGARPDLVKPIMPTSECRFLPPNMQAELTDTEDCLP